MRSWVREDVWIFCENNLSFHLSFCVKIALYPSLFLVNAPVVIHEVSLILLWKNAVCCSHVFWAHASQNHPHETSPMTSSLSIVLLSLSVAAVFSVVFAQSELDCPRLGFVPTQCTAANCEKLAKAVGEAGAGRDTCQSVFRIRSFSYRRVRLTRSRE
jgi:hypothetical protein